MVGFMIHTDNSHKVHVGCQGWNYDDWVTPAARRARGLLPARHARRPHARRLRARVRDRRSRFDLLRHPARLDLRRLAQARPRGLHLRPEAAAGDHARARAAGRGLGARARHVLRARAAARRRSSPPCSSSSRRSSRRPPRTRARSRSSCRSCPKTSASPSSCATRSGSRRSCSHRSGDTGTSRSRSSRGRGSRASACGARRRRCSKRPTSPTCAGWARATSRASTRCSASARRTSNAGPRPSSASRARLPHIYAYFSNYYEGHAPASANKLKRLLGQHVVGPEDLENQPSLF